MILIAANLSIHVVGSIDMEAITVDDVTFRVPQQHAEFFRSAAAKFGKSASLRAVYRAVHLLHTEGPSSNDEATSPGPSEDGSPFPRGRLPVDFFDDSLPRETAKDNASTEAALELLINMIVSMADHCGTPRINVRQRLWDELDPVDRCAGDEEACYAAVEGKFADADKAPWRRAIITVPLSYGEEGLLPTHDTYVFCWQYLLKDTSRIGALKRFLPHAYEDPDNIPVNPVDLLLAAPLPPQRLHRLIGAYEGMNVGSPRDRQLLYAVSCAQPDAEFEHFLVKVGDIRPVTSLHGKVQLYLRCQLSALLQLKSHPSIPAAYREVLSRRCIRQFILWFAAYFKKRIFRPAEDELLAYIGEQLQRSQYLWPVVYQVLQVHGIAGGLVEYCCNGLAAEDLTPCVLVVPDAPNTPGNAEAALALTEAPRILRLDTKQPIRLQGRYANPREAVEAILKSADCSVTAGLLAKKDDVALTPVHVRKDSSETTDGFIATVGRRPHVSSPESDALTTFVLPKGDLWALEDVIIHDIADSMRNSDIERFYRAFRMCRGWVRKLAKWCRRVTLTAEQNPWTAFPFRKRHGAGFQGKVIRSLKTYNMFLPSVDVMEKAHESLGDIEDAAVLRKLIHVVNRHCPWVLLCGVPHPEHLGAEQYTCGWSQVPQWSLTTQVKPIVAPKQPAASKAAPRPKTSRRNRSRRKHK